MAAPTAHIFKDYLPTLLRMIATWFGPTGCNFLVVVFSLSYITKTIGIPNQTAFTLLMISNVFGVVATVAGGMFADRYGRKPALYLGSIVSLAMTLVFFPILNTGSIPLILAALIVFVSALSFDLGVMILFFGEPFPTSVRYSGAAVTYTVANAIAGGGTPFIAGWLIHVTGGATWPVSAYCALLLLMTVILLHWAPETKGVDLEKGA